MKLFQSTPSYEGELCDSFVVDTTDRISIHSLIRGRTTSKELLKIPDTISIHSLIRGRTGCDRLPIDLSDNFNPLPHTRENNKNSVLSEDSRYFNPLPHTRENCDDDKLLYLNNISIHSLIRGRTNIRSKLFWRYGYFNPLPHTRENENSAA